MRGQSVDSLYAYDSNYFRYVVIPINEEKYFNAYFQFRFLNCASLDANPDADYVTNCDQWNIDYVYIDYNRSSSDSSFRDIAFVNPAQSLLKEYTCVPYNQYRPFMMKDSLNIKIANLYSTPLSSTYKYYIYDEDKNLIHSYDGGFENIPSLLFSHEFQTSENHTKPPVQYAFNLMNSETEYEIIHIATEGVGQDNLQDNDTIKFKQVFSNYFAYDDGTSEGGFGINPLKGSNLALGFSLQEKDTLNAIDIYFNKTNNRDTSDKKYFFLCVWDATTGDTPLPNNIIYKSERLLPHSDSLNKFTRYYLNEPLILSEGDFFVSLEIKNKGDYINIGFDRNNNASSHTYSKISSGADWQQAFVFGALMIRPYFGYKTVGLDNIATEQRITAYPNPTKDIINVNLDRSILKEAYITSTLGIREKIQFNNTSQGNYTIDISSKEVGVYILTLVDDKKQVYSIQIIKTNK